MPEHPFDSELLAPAPQFNIVRAMVSDAVHLGLTMDTSSPFNTL